LQQSAVWRRNHACGGEAAAGRRVEEKLARVEEKPSPLSFAYPHRPVWRRNREGKRREMKKRRKGRI
jgi:hypothetical protein